ncbi:MAG TPA: hypothetical protein DHV72_00470 [Serratia grimesii]|uniref:Peptidase C58 YopT-type domain-containing protein n=1 Tax=Serratia grimesii TaxID=82995 RepID=A0A9C7QRH2_9GAMM|nr:YopT-type cysteine protease domain-containing protein [Serratia grimesii]HCJ98491.1 hypothetical protein [Serratia grimesii]
MSLQQLSVHKKYFKFLDDYNGGEGVCVGISLVWIMRNIDEHGRTDSPIDDSPGLRRAWVYQRDSNAADDDKGYAKRLEWLGNRLDECFDNISFEIKESKSKTFSSSEDNKSVKKKVKDYLADNEKDIAFILFFEAPIIIGHAIAIFQPARKTECYVYDPNVGVSLWKSSGRELCDEIEERFILEEKVQYTLCAGLFVKSW